MVSAYVCMILKSSSGKPPVDLEPVLTSSNNRQFNCDILCCNWYAEQMAVILDPSGLLFNGRIIAQGDAGRDPVKGFFKVSTALFLTFPLHYRRGVLLLLTSRQILCSRCVCVCVCVCVRFGACVCVCAWQGLLFA